MEQEQNAKNVIAHQKVYFKGEAQDKILKGAEILCNAVKSTMGPSGHSVIIDPFSNGAPLITKDGVTVARSIRLKDKLESIGAELIKEVASKTNELGGDGTTTATVLGYNMLKEGFKLISSGRNSIELKKGMELGCEEVLNFLRTTCVPITTREEAINVGTISANGDRELGTLIANAIDKVGKDGIITIEQAKNIETVLEVVEGMQVENGFLSPYFITNSEKASCEFENAYVLLTSNKITGLNEILPALEAVSRANKPLLIVADDVQGEALHTLIVNKMKGVVKVCAIKAPSYGEHRADILSDLAQVVGGTVIGATSEMSLKNVTLKELGSAKRIIVKRGNTTFVANNSNEAIKTNIQKRVGELRTVLAEEKTLDALRISKYRQRLAKLSGGVAIIKVGGSTEVEILEKKDRVEDAVNATLAASQEGIVPGGGTALFYASRHLLEALKTGHFGEQSEDIGFGIKAIAKVCLSPLRTIVENTGASFEVVKERLEHHIEQKPYYVDATDLKPKDKKALIKELANVLAEENKESEKFKFGFDAAKQEYVDMFEKGIIDPVKVTRYALSHSMSVVGLLMTCNAVVVNED
jgi:chaperonin GroEL